MKKLIILIAAPILFSCGNAVENKIAESTDQSKADTAIVTEKSEAAPILETSKILGYYVGEFEAADVKPNRTYFYKNKINISIDSVANGLIKGHSVVAGNNRPFNGTYKMEGTNYVVDVKEPGDDKYDGVFSFTIEPDKSNVSGTWTANNTKLEVNKRKYSLSKASFKYEATNELKSDLIVGAVPQWDNIADLAVDEGYDEIITDDAVKINASAVKLKKADVENMYKGDLEIMRNAIYARHGYSFKNRKMRYIFDTMVDWYIPVTTDVRNDLTALEKENIELIKRYEEHAMKYYDSFGR